MNYTKIAMTRKINIFIIRLLSYVSITISAQQVNNAFRYRLSSSNSLRLEPNLNKTLLTITADAFLRLIDITQGSTFSIMLQNVDIVVQRENAKQIDFPNCTTSKSAIDALSQPFLAVYGKDGVLMYITVNKNEPELSKNLKLYGASLLQIDPGQISGDVPPVKDRMERFYPGLCPVTSVFSLDASGDIGVVKTADVAKCHSVFNDHRGDSLTCIKNTCNSIPKKSLLWTAQCNLIAKEVDNRTVIETVVLIQQASYRPFVNSTVEIVIESIAGTELISMGPFRFKSPTFKDSINSVNVSGPIYRNVSEDICGQEVDMDIDGLGEVYSALVCEQTFAVMYEDIIERAILCDVK